MISHFNFSDRDQSLYFDIETIRPAAGGLLLSGTVGDGSAEDYFEARLGEQLQVRLLPLWEEESDSLCRRYDQGQLERTLAAHLEELSFRSELSFDRSRCCWTQHFSAEACETEHLFRPAARIERPHPQVCEPGPLWQRRANG